jgi:alkylation response protein AidB-like acyl-CoA dehydrogenase
VDFELNEQQQLFRNTVHEWVDHEVPKSWARELEKDEHNFPHALWGKFAEAEFHGIGLSEEYGGQGGDGDDSGDHQVVQKLVDGEHESNPHVRLGRNHGLGPVGPRIHDHFRGWCRLPHR